ncbi:MAG: AMP-binding protein [Steroidobacteraceae bacterium]
MQKIWLDSYPEGTPADIDATRYPSLVAMFEESCRLYADRPAYHNLGTTLTFRDVQRLSGQFGAYLAGLGLIRGDRIVIMMPNLLQYPVSLFGALRAGLTVVNTNPLYTARELRHQLADSGARCIVILENFAHVLAEVIADSAIEHIVITEIGDLASLPRRIAVNFVVRRIRHLIPPYILPGAVSFRAALARGAQLELPDCSIGAEDIAFLQYTGGTTGVAKGAMLCHRNMVANLLQMAAFWKNILSPGEDVMITPLPLYHVFCLTCDCLLFMQQGSLNVLITNPRDVDAFVRELRKWRMTLITGVDTLYNLLLDHPGFAHLDFSRLKLGAAGGMALQPGTVARWRAVTGRPLAEGYGLTEASPTIACNPYTAPRVGSVGLPLPSTEISIRDGGNEVPIGEAGELCVRGPQVMRGYWHQEAETAAALSPDGWLRTGDIAVMDPDGFLRIVDRKKDMIIVSGFKVFPSEIEGVGIEHPAVLECGCIGVPDGHSGQLVKVFIVVRESSSVTVEQLSEHFSARLAAYKRPKFVEFRQSLPKSNIGKVLRRELMREEAAHAA